MSQKRIWDYYQGDAIDSFDGSVVRLSALVRIAQGLPGSAQRTILNIGTGNGWVERVTNSLGWHAVSLDPSEIAIQRLSCYSVDGTISIIESMPFRANSFDAIFCSEVFEHLSTAQLRAGVQEIFHVLASGGYLIGTVPFNEDLQLGQTMCPECGSVFHRWGHHQSFTIDRMRSLIEQAGLIPVRLEKRSFPFFKEKSGMNTVKSYLVKVAGGMGFQTAYPVLLFIARKPLS